ncbi:MAG TPA: hypothetical protein DD414_01095 [Lachnospiraceae bacterium]|nr:hypothetical protein [Lachnospiraceae bacterium]
MKKCWFMAAVILCLLAGCGKKDPMTEETGFRDDVSPEALVLSVSSELGDEYWADMELAPEFLESWYGISDDMYEEYYGQSPMISANVDTLIVVKAKEDRVSDVKEALDAYRDAMIQDTLQYPSNIPKIQASLIETFGKYVCFVQLGGSAVEEEDEETALAACKEVNEQALSVIEGELTK